MRRRKTIFPGPNSKNVLVIGTGTIGEPLIGLLCKLKKDLLIDNVLFHKRTPLDYEVAKVNSLVDKGAVLVVDEGRVKDFENMGHAPRLVMKKALAAADVVIDCTPAGNENKAKLYNKMLDKVATPTRPAKKRFYVAQGSEKGFGVPYAWGVNDEEIQNPETNFVQVVSCNTHAISRIILACTDSSPENLVSSDIVCIRRANDASQDGGYVPSPTAGKHDDDVYGTHHARDVSDLLRTVTGKPLPIYSSAMKVNTQYMHTIRFSIVINQRASLDWVIKKFKEDKFIATTQHTSANKVFSFGRDHGFYGRIYNQAVVCLPSLSVIQNGDKTKITGFAMTPQDGNSLLTSIAAAVWGLHKSTGANTCLDNYLLKEV
jgi:glyceraldehyde-3-phosphate dehydrogenase/erythrose-4-phosphate dehydrogenase